MSFTRLQSRLALPAVLLLSALSSAAPARADVGETIILRCTHGQSLAGFSQSAYSQALKELSATAEEYTPCANQIRQAQLAAAGRGGSGGAGAETVAPIAASATERQAVARAARSAPTPVRLGSQVIAPGVVHANISSAFSTLPTPLLAMLAFLLACLILLAGGHLRDRVRGQRSD